MMRTAADVSPCGAYRYTLTRSWASGRLPPVCFIMLNPSTADASVDDPTIRRCVGYARAWGYGALHVVNLFALRSTSPVAITRHPDPVCPENDAAIVTTVEQCPLIVCAWGNRGGWLQRDEAILSILRGMGVKPHALRINKRGIPSHPLYLPATLTAIPYER